MHYKLDLWLIEIRETYNLSVTDLIKTIGISRATYYRILSGEMVSEKTKYQIFVAYLDLLSR